MEKHKPIVLTQTEVKLYESFLGGRGVLATQGIMK